MFKIKPINFKENKFFIFIIFIITVLDQVTKQIVLHFFQETPALVVKVLPFFNLAFVVNKGVSFGMFNSLYNGRYIISGVVILIILFLFYLLFMEENKYLKYAYSLIIGGAVGNTVDRLFYGGVIDFLDFHVKSYHWPAFNLADSVIFIGVFVMLLFEFLYSKKMHKL